MEEIVLWRPARKGRPAPNRNRDAARSNNARGKQASAGDADKADDKSRGPRSQKGRGPKGKGKPGGKKQGKPTHATGRPPRADKPVDPDSPFAVLSQLKSKS